MHDPASRAEQATAVLPSTRRPLGAMRPGDPEQIDEYQILGRVPGNHGSDVFVVRAGRQPLRVLKLSGAGELRDSVRLDREAHNLGRVRAGRVATVLATGVWEGRTYFIQEFIDGPTLADSLAEAPDKRLVLADTYRLARGLAEALKDIHAADVVHRDIKPSNIIISDSRGVVVVDFGIARGDGDSRITKHGMAVGTPRYMSPEQVAGAEVDARSDVFAWGLVVGEALLGRHPIVGIEEGLPAALRCQPDRELGASSLGRLVMDALQPSPEHRPTVDQILAELDRTAVLPAPGETLAITLAPRRWQDVRSLRDARELAVPLVDEGLGLLADRLVVFAAAGMLLALIGWLIGFLVGIVVSTPGGGA